MAYKVQFILRNQTLRTEINMRKLTAFALFFLLLNCVYAGPFIVRVPQNEGYPPFFIKKGKKWTGLSIELAEALLKEVRIKPTYREMPFARGLWYLKSGEIQMMLNLSINKDRKEYIGFIGPQLDETVKLIVRKDFKGRINSIDELLKLSLPIGIERKKFYGNFFASKMNQKSFEKKIEIVTDVDSNKMKLHHRRIAGFLGYGYNIFYKFRTDPFFKNFRVYPLKIHNSFVFYGLSKKSVPFDIYNKLKIAYKKIEKRGILKKIRVKYSQFK